MKLIGISGTNGSGKDTVGHLLAKHHNFLFVSVTEMLRNECRSRGLEVSRENLRTISAEWRRENGPGVLIDKAVEVFSAAESPYDGLAVASLRNPGEADRVHELDGTVVWVDADPRIRYQHIHNAHRGREDEDNKTYEEFLQEEHDEMYATDPNDPNTLNGVVVKAKADVTILNESDLDGLRQNVDQALKL